MAKSGSKVGKYSIQINATVTGTQEAVSNLNKLEDGLKKTSKNATVATRSSRRTTMMFLELSRGAEDAASQIGTTGLAGAFRASANNMSQMASLMSPFAGTIVGLTVAAVAAAPVLFKMFNSVESGAEKAKRAAAELKDAIKRETDEMRESFEKIATKPVKIRMEFERLFKTNKLAEEGKFKTLEKNLDDNIFKLKSAFKEFNANFSILPEQLTNRLVSIFGSEQGKGRAVGVDDKRSVKQDKRDKRLLEELGKQIPNRKIFKLVRPKARTKTQKFFDYFLPDIGGGRKAADEAEFKRRKKHQQKVQRTEDEKQGHRLFAEGKITGPMLEKALRAASDNGLNEAALKEYLKELKEVKEKIKKGGGVIDALQKEQVDLIQKIKKAKQVWVDNFFKTAQADVTKIAGAAQDESIKANTAASAKAAKEIADAKKKLQDDIANEKKTGSIRKRFLSSKKSILQREGDGTTPFGVSAATRGTSGAIKGVLKAIKAQRDAEDPTVKSIKEINQQILEVDRKQLENTKDLLKSLGQTI
jgi:hypothetical protein